jgi:hypothetical protein
MIKTTKKTRKMETINNLLNEGLKDFRQAITEGQQGARPYNKQSEYIYKPEKARFKLAVYFKDGNKRYFSSYDNRSSKEGNFVDEYEGFLKLIRLIYTWNGKFKNAIIYASVDPGKDVNSNYNFEVLKVDMYGNKKENTTVNFKTEGKNITFDFERARYLNKFKIQ